MKESGCLRHESMRCTAELEDYRESLGRYTQHAYGSEGSVQSYRISKRG